MMKLLTDKQLQALHSLAVRVGEGILATYHKDFDVFIKNDASPVTQADLDASEQLENDLPHIAPYPVLSEENTPAKPDWTTWETYWLIDPIDGTRHFINKTGDFCICIALIHRHRAVFGLLYQPTTQTAWLAQSGDTAVNKFVNGKAVSVTDSRPTQLTATLSSCLGTKTQQLMQSLPDYTWYRRGSALKYVDIIEGKATLYPKMWDTCEWDSAAGQCLLECCGGKVLRFDNGEALTYGMTDNLVNPHFIAYRYLGDEAIQQLLSAYRQIYPAASQIGCS
ncbi:MAG: hypothetical protein CSA45_06345 [Gammaproteobacteria bacterium]|nr:MAG: hypothetical protein CSA45_06345 [Gammaproteobacteria bacterium]